MRVQPLRLILSMSLIFYLIFLTACSSAIIAVGAGVGVGAVAYSSGESSKIYTADYHSAVDATIATLKHLKIPPSETISDELKTEIQAKRPNGTNITLEVERIDPQQTEVSIRTGTVGIREKHVSQQIHEYIEKRLTSKSENTKKTDSDEKTKTLATKADNTKIENQNTMTEEKAEKDSKKTSISKDKSPLAIHSTDNLEKIEIVILFQQDSNILQQKALEKLDRISTILQENSEATVIITGFPDPDGSLEYKKMLSDSRAKTIKYYLIGKGMDPVKAKTVLSNSIGKIKNQGAEIEIIYSEHENKDS